MNKHWKNKILVLTLIIGLFAIPLTTQAAGKGKYFTAGNFYYHKLSKNTVEVCAVKKQTAGTLVIPASVVYREKKYKVTRIADYEIGSKDEPVTGETVDGNVPALWEEYTYNIGKCPDGMEWIGESRISKLVLPGTITEIGNCAFGDCEKLKKVVFAKKYKKLTIGGSAFTGTAIKSISLPEGTYELKDYALGPAVNIKIPASVKKIGAGVVHSGIKKVTLSKKNKKFKMKDNILYSNDEKTLIGVSGKASKNVVVSPKTVRIAEMAFAWSDVKTVTLNANITEISKGAFSNCKNLSKVFGTEAVTRIGYGAFYGCTGLISIGRLPNLMEIERAAFWNAGDCPIELSSKVMVEDYAFSGTCVSSRVRVAVAANDEKYSIENGLLIKADGDKKTVIMQIQDMEKIEVPEGVTNLVVALGGEKCKEIILPASLKNQQGTIMMNGGTVTYKSTVVPEFGKDFSIYNCDGDKSKLIVKVPEGTALAYKNAIDKVIKERNGDSYNWKDWYIEITDSGC